MNPDAVDRPPIADDWYSSAFDALYPIIYAHRSVEAAAPECAFALEQLALPADAQVLDLCCGNGRHLAHLQRASARAMGLDYSLALLRLARVNAGPEARLVHSDMRALPFPRCFDAVFNFFTSFGYFQRHEENMAVLEEITRCLRPGGRFFMDFLNAPHVVATLLPRSEREQDGYRIYEERWIDTAQQRVNKIMDVFRAGTRVSHSEESVRLYRHEELEQLFQRANLRILRTYGDYGGNALQEDSPRLIAIGERT